jgi:hypothetical protein
VKIDSFSARTKYITVFIVLFALALLLWLPADWNSVPSLHKKLFGFPVPPTATNLKLIVSPTLLFEWKNDTRLIRYHLDPAEFNTYLKQRRTGYLTWTIFNDDSFFGSGLSFTSDQKDHMLVSRNHDGHQYRALVVEPGSGTIYAAYFSTGR